MTSVPADPLGPLLDTLQRTGRAVNTDTVRAAYDFAAKAHGSQVRATGEPYVTHCVAVATILADLLGPGVDGTLIQAAMLHDVVEDTERSLKEVERAFGPEVAGLVDGVS